MESFTKEQKIIFGRIETWVIVLTLLSTENCYYVTVLAMYTNSFPLRRSSPRRTDVLVQPEFKGAIAELADKVTSTIRLLRHAANGPKKDFIVVIENWNCKR